MTAETAEERVLVLFAHPALQKSRVNVRLVSAVRGLPGVTVHDLSYVADVVKIEAQWEPSDRVTLDSLFRFTALTLAVGHSVSQVQVGLRLAYLVQDWLSTALVYQVADKSVSDSAPAFAYEPTGLLVPFSRHVLMLRGRISY